ncbi:MAG: M36 family metallopeptidase [Nocardioides sp.]
MTHLRPSSLLRAATATCLATGLAGGLAAGLTLGPSAGAATTGSGSSVGTASVFEVNPVQSSGDESLTDQKDSATAVPLAQYATVALRNLDGSGYLVGKWANVRTSTGAAAYSPTNTFSYTRDDDRFEQVMAYFWVNQAQEYLQSLGFGSTLPPVNAESQDVRIDQYGVDNSYSTDKQDFLRFGKGGVDDAEDAEVVVHEYGHAVHDAQVPGFGSSLDAGSIGEAFGDYLAVTVGLDADRQYGWPVNAPEPCVMDWDATAYTTTVPHCLRRLDTGRVLEDRIGEVHFDGTIWSAALWDIRQRYVALGLTTRDWDRTLVDSQFGYAPDTSFAAAARATYDTALAMNGSRAAKAVRAAFADRHIYF